MSNLEFDDWVRIGMAHGWCGAPVCSTHDGVPTHSGEDESFDDGDDVCIHVIRLYANDIERELVEINHSPSQWRKRGWL